MEKRSNLLAKQVQCSAMYLIKRKCKYICIYNNRKINFSKFCILLIFFFHVFIDNHERQEEVRA